MTDKTRTVPDIAAKVGLAPDVLRARLGAAGVEVADDAPLRKAAGARGTTPIELLKVLLVEGYALPKK